MTSKNTTGKEKTFWQLLSSYNVSIPTIQRDYVQGRSGKQSQDVRNNLLNDIETHLCAASEKGTSPRLSLNFIYGKIRDRGTKTETFLPVDGQQRLTLLFLLHWYAFVISEDAKADSEIKETFNRFSYETRQTSTDFFKELSSDEVITDVSENLQKSGKPISEYLGNKHWFRPDFNFDPTIQSAIVVLDDLQKRFKGKTDLWSVLKADNCPLYFEWLDTDCIGDEDDLYIKMNARGKPLSDFENFKAELEAAAKEKERAPKEGFDAFFKNFDLTWTDMFWRFPTEGQENHENTDKKIDAERELYDQRFMAFLNWFFWNEWAACTSVKTDFQIKELTQDNENKDLIDPGDTHWRKIGDFDIKLSKDRKHVIDSEALERLSWLLNDAADNSAPPIRKIIKTVSTNGKNATYKERMHLASATAYLAGIKKRGKKFEEASWEKWNRIIRHLTDAAGIWRGFDPLGRYAVSVKTVMRLSEFADDLEKHFADPALLTEKRQSYGFLPEEQFDEEKLKAKLMTMDISWRKLIREAESILYFRGKIGFLFDFIGLDLTNLSTVTYEQAVDFQAYLSLVKILFSNKNDRKYNENDYGWNDNKEYRENYDIAIFEILRKALITKGNFSIEKSSGNRNRSFLVSPADEKPENQDTISLRNYFRKNNRILFKKLLDDLKERLGNETPTVDKIKSLLSTISEEGKKSTDNSGKKYIERALVVHPELLSSNYFGESWLYREEGGIFYLLQSTELKGYNRELSSSLIRLLLKPYSDDKKCEIEEFQIRGRLYEWKEANEECFLEISSGEKTLEVKIGIRAPVTNDQKADKAENFSPYIKVTEKDAEQGEMFPYENYEEAVGYIKEQLGLTESK